MPSMLHHSDTRALFPLRRRTALHALPAAPFAYARSARTLAHLLSGARSALLLHYSPRDTAAPCSRHCFPLVHTRCRALPAALRPHAAAPAMAHMPRPPLLRLPDRLAHLLFLLPATARTATAGSANASPRAPAPTSPAPTLPAASLPRALSAARRRTVSRTNQPPNYQKRSRTTVENYVASCRNRRF